MKKSYSPTSAFYAMKEDYIKYLGIVAQKIVKHRRRLRSLSISEKSELDVVDVVSLAPKSNVRLLVLFVNRYVTPNNIVTYLDPIYLTPLSSLFLPITYYLYHKFYPNERVH